jgi:hypothetical protein
LYKIYKYPQSLLLANTPQQASSGTQPISLSKNLPETDPNSPTEILEAKDGKDKGDLGGSGGYNLNGLESNILAKTEQVYSKYEDRGGEDDFDSDIDTFREKKGTDGGGEGGKGVGKGRYKSNDQSQDGRR